MTVELAINGGLGNQLWQAAFGVALEQYLGRPVLYRPQYASDSFNRSFVLHRYFPALRRFTVATPSAAGVCYKEPIFVPDAAEQIREIIAFVGSTDKPILEGYWLNDDYWMPHEHLVRYALRIEGLRTDHIGVHVRRSEYGHHGLAKVSYYKNAIAETREEVGPLPVLLFTDEFNFCAFEFRDVPDLEVIRGDLIDPISDFRRLSFCKHYVLSNSSFATWAAKLGARPDSIIYAPLPQCLFIPELSPPRHWRLVEGAVQRQ